MVQEKGKRVRIKFFLKKIIWDGVCLITSKKERANSQYIKISRYYYKGTLR